jgi:N-acetylmuramoyl-L-alanine amidase
MSASWLRFVTLALMACLVVSGCRHRRSTLRPVFVNPGPTYLQVPTESVVPESTIDEPAARFTPAEPLPAPRYDNDFESGLNGPISVSPPAAPAPEAESEPEPELEAAPRDAATVPSRVGDEPAISPPQSFRTPQGADRTRLTAGPSLRQLVQQRADDPLDLVQPPKADRAWRYIAIHHSGESSGGYAQLDRQHRDSGGLNGCGYHFVIGNGTDSEDGTIEVTRRWSEQKPSRHCREATDPGVNDYGIAICLVGDFEHQEPTAQQLESARLLVRYLKERYDVPNQNIGTHTDLAAGHVESGCPGRNLPRSDIVAQPALSRR